MKIIKKFIDKNKKSLIKLMHIIIHTFVYYYLFELSYILSILMIKNQVTQFIKEKLGIKLILGRLAVKSLGDATLDGVKVAITKLPQLKVVYVASYLIFMILAIIYMVILIKIYRPKKQLTSHGSARWGEFKDLGFTSDKTKPFETSLLNDTGVVLGRMNGVTLRDNAKTHVLVTAPTRTGKGVSIIIPTLIDTWKDSVIVLDIKGENYQMTSGARKEHFDNRILRFAPKSKNSCRFNPLMEIRFLTEYEVEDVRLVAKMLCQGDGGDKKDPYWDNRAADLLQGVILYCLYKEFLQNPDYEVVNGVRRPLSRANFAQVSDFFTDPNYTKPVRDILRDIATGENILSYAKDEATAEYVRGKLLELYEADHKLINQGKQPVVAKLFMDFANTPEQTFGSILSTATDKISIFNIPIVKRNTLYSDFRINDLMNYEKPVSLYLVVEPAAIVLMSPLIRILLVQVVNLLTPEVDYTGRLGGHKHRCLMLLDEFPAIGKMEVLEKGIGYVAGYGMKLMIILQSLDQLYKIYGKENMFLSNCQVQAFYTANDTTTGEYVEKSLGSETIENYTQSKGGGVKLHAKNQQFVGKKLLSLDEVRRFPLDKILLLVAGKPPFKADKIQYFAEKEYKEKSSIPYIYTESCYDTSMVYLKNTTDKHKEIKFVPYRACLSNLKEMLNEDLDFINSLKTRAENNELDKDTLTMYKNRKQFYEKNISTYNKYMELIDLLDPNGKVVNKEDELLKELKKSMNKNSIQINTNKTDVDIALDENTNSSEIKDGINIAMSTNNNETEAKGELTSTETETKIDNDGEIKVSDTSEDFDLEDDSDVEV